jgi:hypothetical protein
VPSPSAIPTTSPSPSATALRTPNKTPRVGMIGAWRNN